MIASWVIASNRVLREPLESSLRTAAGWAIIAAAESRILGNLKVFKVQIT